MIAIQILAHAWRMITHDPAATLRVVLVPILVATVPLWAFEFLESGSVSGEAAAPNTNETVDGTSDFLLLLSFLCLIVGWIWVAISWHRYALTGEAQDGWLPSFPWDVFGRYLGKASLITVLVIPLILFSVVLFVVFEDLDGQIIETQDRLPSIIQSLAFGLIYVFFSYAFMRFGPALVAIALGKTGQLRQAWRSTASVKSTIWQLSFVLSGLSIATDYADSFTAGTNAGRLLSEGLWCILELLHISVITTLYGVIVEGRDLKDRA